ncbi:MAG: DNA-directed RNA polymerase subunit B, partial [Methanocalculus sp.]|nr:DNA-directed RNA polymerase subunit B [Methanocalculus sp.]
MSVKTRIFVDGALIGVVDDGQALAARVRQLRRRGELSSEINVSFKEYSNEIVINTDRGRARRPLIILDQGLPIISDDDIDKIRAGQYSFEDMVSQGKIEYVDAEEEDDLYIA